MDTKKAQDMIRHIYIERDRARGLERTLLRTFEELGELSDAILRSKSKNELSDEVADVFAWVCSIANLLDIDLSEALYNKYSGVCSKCGRTPCECTEAP